MGQNYKPNREDVKSYMKMVDSDGDGRISLAEFEEIILRSLKNAGFEIYEWLMTNDHNYFFMGIGGLAAFWIGLRGFTSITISFWLSFDKEFVFLDLNCSCFSWINFLFRSSIYFFLSTLTLFEFLTTYFSFYIYLINFYFYSYFFLLNSSISNFFCSCSSSFNLFFYLSIFPLLISFCIYS